MSPRVRWCTFALLAVVIFRAGPAHGERFHACADFIDTLPAALIEECTLLTTC